MTNNQLTDEQIAQLLGHACMVIGDRFATVDELSAAKAIRALAVELQERRKAAMDSEPVAYMYDGEDGREYNGHNEFSSGGKGIPLYLHAQPAPEKYNIGDATMRHIFTPTGMTNVSDMQAVFDRVEAVLVGMEQPASVVPKSISVREAISALESADAVTTIGQAYKMGWNACRAAMLSGGKS